MLNIVEGLNEDEREEPLDDEKRHGRPRADDAERRCDGRGRKNAPFQVGIEHCGLPHRRGSQPAQKGLDQVGVDLLIRAGGLAIAGRACPSMMAGQMDRRKMRIEHRYVKEVRADNRDSRMAME